MNPVFVLIAVFTLGAGAWALAQRDLIRVALGLIAAWAGVAAFYLWAGASFVSFAQALVYVGAISMVALFAVVLTRKIGSGDPALGETGGGWPTARAAAGIASGVAVAAVLVCAVVGMRPHAARRPARPLPVREIGRLIAGPHAAALLIVGAILTVALIGAVVLAAGGAPAGEEEVP